MRSHDDKAVYRLMTFFNFISYWYICMIVTQFCKASIELKMSTKIMTEWTKYKVLDSEWVLGHTHCHREANKMPHKWVWQGTKVIIMHLSISCPTPRRPHTPGGDLTLTLVPTPGVVDIEVEFFQFLWQRHGITLATVWRCNSAILDQMCCQTPC